MRTERECLQCGERIYSDDGFTAWHTVSIIREPPGFVCSEDDMGLMPHEPMEPDPLPNLNDLDDVRDWLEA